MPATPPRRTAWGSIAQAADLWKVNPKTVRRWIAGGLIRAERIGPRLVRVDLDSVQQLGQPIAARNGDAA